jgi:hypothetical protein
MAVVLLGAVSINVVVPFVFPKQATVSCTLKDMRPTEHQALVDASAVIVYERNGGTSCVDELYAIYADGHVTSDYGDNNVKKSQVDSGPGLHAAQADRRPRLLHARLLHDPSHTLRGLLSLLNDGDLPGPDQDG